MGVLRVWTIKYHNRAAAVLKRSWMIGVCKPQRRDYWMVAFMLALQVAFLACAAISGFFVKAEVETVRAGVENPGFLGFFVHNSLVFLFWALGGAVTFGLIAVVGENIVELA